MRCSRFSALLAVLLLSWGSALSCSSLFDLDALDSNPLQPDASVADASEASVAHDAPGPAPDAPSTAEAGDASDASEVGPALGSPLVYALRVTELADSSVQSTVLVAFDPSSPDAGERTLACALSTKGGSPSTAQFNWLATYTPPSSAPPLGASRIAFGGLTIDDAGHGDTPIYVVDDTASCGDGGLPPRVDLQVIVDSNEGLHAGVRVAPDGTRVSYFDGDCLNTDGICGGGLIAKRVVTVGVDGGTPRQLANGVLEPVPPAWIASDNGAPMELAWVESDDAGTTTIVVQKDDLEATPQTPLRCTAGSIARLDEIVDVPRDGMESVALIYEIPSSLIEAGATDASGDANAKGVGRASLTSTNLCAITPLVAPAQGLVAREIALSPDSHWLALSTNLAPDGGPLPHTHIWIMDSLLGGAAPCSDTTADVDDQFPTWIADGTLLSFTQVGDPDASPAASTIVVTNVDLDAGTCSSSPRVLASGSVDDAGDLTVYVGAHSDGCCAVPGEAPGGVVGFVAAAALLFGARRRRACAGEAHG